MTKEIADSIVESNKNFYVKHQKIDDVDVYIYNYNSGDEKFFETPDHNELRGLTITVQNETEKVYHSIKKYYELDEISKNTYSALKDIPIKKVLEKIDGVLIQFIPINGELHAKTKYSFDSEPAEISQNILSTDEELQFFILDCYTNNWTPLFELTGSRKVDYDKAELKLIGVRDENGNHLDLETFNYKNKVKTYDYTLEEAIEKAKTLENFEGFVVRFKGGHQIKIKTDWYKSKWFIPFPTIEIKF